MQEDGSVSGLVSLDDLLEAVSGELDALAGILRTGIAGEESRPVAMPSRGLHQLRHRPG